jgi:hypothetical protein
VPADAVVVPVVVDGQACFDGHLRFRQQIFGVVGLTDSLTICILMKSNVIEAIS